METEIPEISKETVKRVLEAIGQAHKEANEQQLSGDDFTDDEWTKLIKEILDRGNTYPQILIFDKFDSIPWDFEEQLGLDDDRPIDAIEVQALKLAEKEKAKVYVQIDGPNGERVYHLGIPDRHYNKTGIYEVAQYDYWET